MSPRKQDISLVRAVSAVFLFIILAGFVLQNTTFLQAAVFGDPPQGSTKYDLTTERITAIITGLVCWLADIALLLIVGAIRNRFGMQFWEQLLLLGYTPSLLPWPKLWEQM
ncbi:MAG: hypothetical protein KW806_03510 [Candidatus Yanofskybacteria bacterium]|nr:hypothetical protein [Candidatus Yanofskybacteria bacterium]